MDRRIPNSVDRRIAVHHLFGLIAVALLAALVTSCLPFQQAGACSSDADCADGQACDVDQHRCVSVGIPDGEDEPDDGRDVSPNETTSIDSDADTGGSDESADGGDVADADTSRAEDAGSVDSGPGCDESGDGGINVCGCRPELSPEAEKIAETNANAPAFWLRADFAETAEPDPADGGEVDVTRLCDLSGNGLEFRSTASDTNPPSHVAPASIGKKPALSFDGSDEAMSMTGDSSIEARNFTAFFVLRRRDNNSHDQLLSACAIPGENNIQLRYEPSSSDVDLLHVNHSREGSSAQTDELRFGREIPAESWQVLRLSFRNSELTASRYPNGSPEQTSNNPAELAVDAPWIFNRIGIRCTEDEPETWFFGEIAEVIFYDEAVGDKTGSRDEIVEYFNERYGIAPQ